MRKLKLQVQMSVDGFIAGPNREMGWTVFDWDDRLKDYTRQITEPVDCIVLGRKLAEGFIPHWASNPEGEDPAAIYKFNNTPKVVFTKTLEKPKWKNTVLATGDLVDEIIQLRSSPAATSSLTAGRPLFRRSSSTA